MKALVGAFNQEKALVGAFSVITNLRMEFGWNFLKHYSIQLYTASIRRSELRRSITARTIAGVRGACDF